MTATTDPHLDLTRLEKVRRSGTKITARCPACAAAGNDRSGEHLVIFPSGKFACAALPGDCEHRRDIFRLVGVVGDRPRDPWRDREWREKRAQEAREAAARVKLEDVARTKRAAIVERHPWALVDVWGDSPQQLDDSGDPRLFLASLFPADALVWTGQVHDSGKPTHSSRWRTCAGWSETSDAVGPMTAPAVWRSGTISRSAGNVLTAPYTVLDFDGFDGIKPETPEEIEEHVAASLALTRWMREGLRWQLAAIVWTGGKSVHAWFRTPPPAAIDSLRTTAAAFGIDRGLIGCAEHPCRLPGQRHKDTGKLSETLWLQTHHQ